MAKEFINPNFHVILIHYPLALLTLGTLIELFAFLWRRSAFRAAGRWMILLGALLAAPTALSGLYAMADVNKSSNTALDATWNEVRAASPVQGDAWEHLTRHAWINGFVTAGLLALVVIWLGSSDVWRNRLHLPLLLALIALVGGAGVGAWDGGEMIYAHGVAVEPMREHMAGETAGTAETKSAATAEHASAKEPHHIEYYLPPLQVHVILAGLVIAVAMAALGLSLRAGAQYRVSVEPTPELSDIAAAFVPPAPRPRAPTIVGPGGAVAPDYTDEDVAARVDVQYERVPMRRFWLLASLLALLTAGAGIWLLAGPEGVDSWDPGTLWREVVRNPSTDARGGITRREAHVCVGVGIVVLPLLLALVGRAVAVRRLMIGLFTLILLTAVAGQIWLGSLLLFDTPAGAITHFNRGGGAGGGATTEPAALPTETMPATGGGAGATTTAPAPKKAPAAATVPAL